MPIALGKKLLFRNKPRNDVEERNPVGISPDHQILR
jgi:hypothetical protein